MKLRSHLLRLTLAALAPMVVFAVAAGWLAVQREKAVFRGGATERTRALLTAVDSELWSNTTSLQVLATSLNLQLDELQAFHHEAERTLASQPHWRRIVLSRASGIDVVDPAVPLGADVPPVADRASFEHALRTRKPAVGNLFAVGEGFLFVVSIPMPQLEEPRYVLSAVVHPAQVMEILNVQRLPPDWVGVVLDGERQIVARTMNPEATVGRLASEDLRAALAHDREGWFHGLTLEGAAVYSPYNSSSATGWSVALGIPASVVEAGTERMLLVLALGILAASGIAVLLAFVIGRRITAPITALASVARSLEQGLPVVEPLAGGVAEVRAVSRTLVAGAHAAREREEALRRADKAKDEFLAMLGHELRNPLSALASAVQLLKLGGDEEETAHTAHDVIERQIKHMARLVDDLLDVSRVTHGKVNLSLRPLDLGALVERVADELRSSGSLDRHDVRVDAHTAWVRADEERMEQVVGNLFGNALKYTPSGGGIEIDVRRRGSEAVLTITDTGVGMSPELCAQVFDLFVQGERSLDRSLGGLGIGLTLAKALVDQHGGTIVARSDGAGRGATFEVRLPTVEAPREGDGEAPAAPAGSVSRRILLVEDNDDVRRSLRAALVLQGHRVLEASDGERGIELATRERPEVAVVDIGLPGADGYEVARRLRALQGGTSMLLVALTGYGQRESRGRALDAGFDEYVTKPISPEVLAQRIESACAPPGAGA